jgi:DNA polymerase V
VLHCAYTNEKARLIAREMADQLVLDLVDKGLVTDSIVLTVGYDIENLTDLERRKKYTGPVVTDHYGRQVPKHAHGTVNLPMYNSSTSLIVEAVVALFDRITDPNLLVRRVNHVACHIIPEHLAAVDTGFAQLDLFADPEEERRREQQAAELNREKRRQKAVLTIKKKFGKNAIVKGMNLEEGATAMDRNGQIGGHKA